MDATNCKGLYRLDLSDAAIASGAYTVISIEFDGIIEESLVIPLHTREVNVTQWNGTAVATPDTAGYPVCTVKDGTGAGEIALTTGKIDEVTTLTGHTAQTGDSFARIGATGSGLTSLAQASVVGALADAAAAGDPTASDTLVAYAKQIINTLEGTAGIPTYPAEAAPGNAVSLAEVIRAIHADVTGLNGDVMRGTDSALLAASNGSGLTEAGGTGDHLTALPWNAAWDAEVESEVNDAIDTAISELGVAAPTATPTIRTGLMLLYMMARNKLVVQTSGVDAIEVYNDAGTKIAAKAITDDGSDYTEAEMA